MNTSTASHADYYFQKQVETASRGKLILMLYDGLMRNLESSCHAIDHHQVELAHRKLMKAQDILSELIRSLNPAAGQEVARNLLSLYEFMVHLLVEANLRKDAAHVRRAIDLLKPIRDGWAQMMQGASAA